jgi:tRNA threonylcarbamoyladenosine biosynthesis protein TsaE
MLVKTTHQTASANETERLGMVIGRQLRGGEVIELRSDVGGGKTTLTRGIVKGAGSDAVVASPTFTVTKHYQIAEHPTLHGIVHADMYRLQDPGIIKHELADVVDSNTVLIIEWADTVDDVLPDERIVIELQATGSEQQRNVTITIPNRYDYIAKELVK